MAPALLVFEAGQLAGAEPQATAVALLAAGLLLLLSVLASRASRLGVPVVLLFLGLGMLMGSEGIGRVAFENYALAYRIGTLTLVLILFDGGLRTPRSVVRRGLAPATLLATVGVAITAVLVCAVARLLGYGWTEGLLLGAIVSSTDAAAVFSVLRGGGVALKQRAAAVLELESGLNDPLAVLLTVTLTRAAAEGHVPNAAIVPLVVAELAVGAALGAAAGFGGRALLARYVLRASGLYPLVTAALALLTYGAVSLAHGSGFLAVYVAGVVLGNGRLPFRSALFHVHDFVAWTSQIAMFVMLGLLVVPSRLVRVAPTGLALAAWLAFVGRPVAVAACLMWFRFSARKILLIAWVGLRGAVPIVLAVIPILAGVDTAHHIFDVVFFVVLVSTLLQGTTARWFAGRLGLARREAEAPAALLEIASRQPLGEELMSFHISPLVAVCGARVADVPFPEGASAMLIVRGDALLAPRGDTVLKEGDHVFVFCRGEDAPLLKLLFGRAEEE